MALGNRQPQNKTEVFTVVHVLDVSWNLESIAVLFKCFP